MDLSPFAAQGGQSHFRGENVDLFATSFLPRKLGQSPVNGYRSACCRAIAPAPPRSSAGTRRRILERNMEPIRFPNSRRLAFAPGLTLPLSLRHTTCQHPRSVNVHSLDGDWSLFRQEIAFGAKNVDRKHGPVPFRGARGTVPFSRRERQLSCDVLSTAKIGTVPCERLPPVPSPFGRGLERGRLFQRRFMKEKCHAKSCRSCSDSRSRRGLHVLAAFLRPCRRTPRRHVHLRPDAAAGLVELPEHEAAGKHRTSLAGQGHRARRRSASVRLVRRRLV